MGGYINGGVIIERTHDRGGNILTKKRYAYTTGSGTVQETVTYTYGYADWKDQLTSISVTADGVTTKAITYDAVGNPTNDGTWPTPGSTNGS